MSYVDSLARRWRANEFPALVLTTAALVALLVGAASLFVDSLLVVRPGDAPKYLQLAQAPFSSATAPSPPFRFRALTPFLVWLLPTGPVVGFAIVNLSALVATGVALYYYLRELGFDARKSLVGVVFFVVSPAIAYLVTNVVLVDAVALLLLVCALWAAARDEVWKFAFALALGVAAKEAILFALPVYVLYRLQLAGLRGIIRPFAAALPAGGILGGLRLFYGFSNDTLGATVARGVAAQLDKLELSIFYIPYEVYSAFGTLWLFAFCYGCWRVLTTLRSSKSDAKSEGRVESDGQNRHINSEFLVAGLLVAPLAFLQPLIARDIARVLFVVFPVVIPAALAAIAAFSRRAVVGLVGLAGAAAVAGVVGALVVLPALAGNVASVSLPALQFLALVGAANELLVIGVLLGARKPTGEAPTSAQPQRS